MQGAAAELTIADRLALRPLTAVELAREKEIFMYDMRHN
jgi:hypothetical protein